MLFLNSSRGVSGFSQPTKEDLAASFDAAAGDGLGQGDHAEVRVQVRDGLPAILSANSANV